MINIDETLYVIDEKGNEVEMQILFTFESEEYNKSYVLFFDPNDTAGEIHAYSYDEAGNLNSIEDQAEWAMIDEVLETYQNEKTFN
ncbi:MAG: DUF1292 domain-containing protein [Erysipelotrichaceae bacterium]